jgi:phosphoribosylaminoimidazole-succinocarboxamide synthase
VTTKRKLKPRPTYRQHSEKEIQDAIRGAMLSNSVLMDYLQEIGLEFVDGKDDFERGIAEGRRRLAGELITVALSDPFEETN